MKAKDVTEAETTERTKMLIELAFLLPRGTNMYQHSAYKQLARYVKAIRASAKATRVEKGTPK